MVRVLHRARGWVAVWSGITGRRSLPGDDRGLADALHVLTRAGMLPPNPVTPGWGRRAPCPRCGRPTAVGQDDMPTVCAACRAEWMGGEVARRG